MNTFGVKIRLTTFGESHGIAIGGILDGFPAGVKINFDFLQNELDKRKPGSKFATKSIQALPFLCRVSKAILAAFCSASFLLLPTASPYFSSPKKTPILNSFL